MYGTSTTSNIMTFYQRTQLSTKATATRRLSPVLYRDTTWQCCLRAIDAGASPLQHSVKKQTELFACKGFVEEYGIAKSRVCRL